MASASRDKFSRDDEPELGDIDANVLDDVPAAPAPKASRAAKTAAPAPDADAAAADLSASTAEPSATSQVRPVHTFGWTRMVFWPLVLAFVALQYRLWIGEGSFAEVWRLTLEIEKQEQENHVLGERNRRLSAEVRDLREGGAAVEERARKQLGMVKDDETLYIIHPKSP
jgi:cell division protein FtsB